MTEIEPPEDPSPDNGRDPGAFVGCGMVEILIILIPLIIYFLVELVIYVGEHGLSDTALMLSIAYVVFVVVLSIIWLLSGRK